MHKRVIEIRNYLHTIPEPSTKEEKTSAWIAEQLKKAGYDVETNIAGMYGVVGTLKGKQAGNTVGIRADMDALLHVVNDVEQAMHTCGHDGNCAMVLSVAEKIASEGLEKGTLKVIFQPSEENLEGALVMAKAGVVNDLDYLIGGHLRPIAEAKLGEATPALVHGASMIIKAEIHGKQSHGARPHLGINAIDAACLVVNAISAIKEVPSKSWSAKTTMFNSNTVVTNAIPDKVSLAFDFRAENNEIADSMKAKVYEIVENAPKAIGATGEITSFGFVPAANYDDEVTNILSECIVETLGSEGLLPPIITPGGDDFHFFKHEVQKLKVGFIGIGANLTPGLHMPEMTFDENALCVGADIYYKALKKLL